MSHLDGPSMAPPRNRGANIDDSRSEASSGPRERQAAGAKARRLGNAAVVAAANKDVKSTLPTAAGGDPEPGTGENLGVGPFLSFIKWQESDGASIQCSAF